jgi:hypothetical protein
MLFKWPITDKGYLVSPTTVTFETPLKYKEYIKYLGIIIDCNLSWKHHIDYIALKISKNWYHY